MSEESKKTVEPSLPTVPVRQEAEIKPANQGAFAGFSRQLKEGDLVNNLPAIRLILTMLDEKEVQANKVPELTDKLSKSQIEGAVFKEKNQSLRQSVNAKMLLVTLGGIAAGYLPSAFSFGWGLFGLLALVAIIFLLVGFLKNEHKNY